MPRGRRTDRMNRTLLVLAAGLMLAACGKGGEIVGTAIYRERIALPPNAIFEATLADVSRADAPAEVINSVTLESPGTPPYNFTIPFKGEQIDKRHRYSVRGAIRVDGKLLMTTDQAFPVITRGMPRAVTLLLKGVAQPRQPETAEPDRPPLPDRFTGAHGLTLPATYTGVLPCADCPGILWHLNLMPDQTFYAELEYLERDGVFADSGRWYLEAQRQSLVLSGRGGTDQRFAMEDGKLVMRDADGAPLPAGMNDTLRRADAFSWTDVSHPMRGQYDPATARFTDCLSGHSYPVMGDTAMLREAGSGGPVTLDIRARITRPKEGGDAVVQPRDVIRTYLGEGCARHRATAPLENTYWRLVELDGEAVRITEGRREPHLLLRPGDMHFTATVGCNQMGGTYRRSGDGISFSETRTTLMACGPPLDALERRFKNWLSRSATWRLNDQSLEITTREGATALFEAVYFQ